MTESEAYELFAIIAAQQNDLMFGYFSVISAFLIMSYFVAEKLDRILASITALLYSLCCLWFGMNLYAFHSDSTKLYVEMLKKKEAGVYELEWFGSNPNWIAEGVTGLQLTLVVGGWLISLFYFVYRRRLIGAI